MNQFLFIGLLGLLNTAHNSELPVRNQVHRGGLAPASVELKQHAFDYKTYYNRSRMFKIDYPSFLTMGPGSQNGDGREFFTNGGVIRLSVYSSYDSESSIDELYYDELSDRSVRITYKVLRSNWYVVSGIIKANGKEFYKKVYYSSRYGDQIRTMWLEYPQSRVADFDIIIPRLVQSFKDI